MRYLRRRWREVSTSWSTSCSETELAARFHLCDLAWRGEMRRRVFSLPDAGMYCMVRVESAASFLGVRCDQRAIHPPPIRNSFQSAVFVWSAKNTTRICTQIRVEDSLN